VKESDTNSLFSYLLTHVLRTKDVRLLPVVNDIPDNYAATVGRIIATWSEVEWMIRSSSYPLLGLTSKEGRVAVRDPRLEDHITMIEQLLSLRGLKIESNLPAIQKFLRQLANYRDLLAHGVWMRDENNNLYIQHVSGNWQPDKSGPSISRKISPEGVQVELKTLEMLLQLMRSVLETVRDMSSEIVRVAASSPRRWPPQSSLDRPPNDPSENTP
jgi:hypothetical protein